MSGERDVTVAICTLGRPESLVRTLESLAAMAPAPGVAWEVLVVDNGNDPGTGAVLADFATRLPVRGVKAPVRGVARARNVAVDNAGGRYICWTDDDVSVGTGWLAAYADAFRRHPDAVAFGGPITPQFEGEPPSWILRHGREWPLNSPLAWRDLGPDARALQPIAGELPWGANHAMRADWQRRHRYDERLTDLGEEIDVMVRAARHGGAIHWVPGAQVTHHITRDRQTLEYLRHYYLRSGRAAAYFWARDGRDNPVSAGAPSLVRWPGPMLRLLRHLTAWIGRYRDEPAIPTLRQQARVGYIDGILAFRRGQF